MPPPLFELKISRLPEKVVIPLDHPGPPVQLSSWFGVKVASVTYFPPAERRINSPDRKVGEGAPPGEEEGAG